MGANGILAVGEEIDPARIASGWPSVPAPKR